MTRDPWTSGERYEPYIGRWSRPVAREFVGWLAVDPGARWVDVGCGTGALAAAALVVGAPASLVGVDPSAGYLGHARARLADPRVRFCVGSAAALPAPDGSADCVVSGLVLNFLPDPGGALTEMRRVAVTGGTVAAYVWDYAEGMRLVRTFWDAATALDPTAVDLDEARRFPLCRPEPLRELFAAAGLRDVRGRAIEVPTVFADFDDYWTPFLGGQGPAPGYCATLAEPARARLRERLRASLPVDGGGGIPLTARAWAVRGTA